MFKLYFTVSLNLIFFENSLIFVRPHFGTVPVPELVVQFRNWNTHIPKLAPCQNGAPSAGTGRSSAGTGLDVILPFTQFQNWTSSFETERPVPELGFIPENPNWNHPILALPSSKMGCPNVDTHTSERVATV